MTATTINPTTRPPRQVRHTTFGQAVRSEWTKIRTVRSTYWTLAIGVIATIGFTVLGTALTAASVNQHPDSLPPGQTSVDMVLGSLFFAQIAFAVLGAMTITSEYSTGMIRTSLSAVPRRGRFLAAKALVFAAIVLVLGEIVSFVSFYVGEALLGGAKAIHTQAIGDPGVLRAVVGGGLYLTLVALLALSIGLLLRHTAGAITSILGLMLVPGILGAILPNWWKTHIINYMPINAGTQIMTTQVKPDNLTPWTGFTVLCVWAVVLLGAAYALFKKRDA